MTSKYKVNLSKYAGINYDAGTMNFKGNIFTGTIYADSFIGNVKLSIPSEANIDIVGNVVGVRLIAENITATRAFLGNGNFISRISKPFNKEKLDIRGNIIGEYANMTVIVATVGNVANVLFENGNATIPGALTADSLLANVAGEYANVTNIVATVGNVANVRFENGNVLIPGALAAGMFNGNVIGGYANVANIVATVGNIANVRFENGNVSAPGVLAAGILTGNVGNIASVRFENGNVSVPGVFAAGILTGNVCNISNVRFENGNVSIPGALAVGIFTGNVAGGYANVTNIVATVGNIANVRFESGNVSVHGTVAAGLFVGNAVSSFGNIGSVRIDNGNVYVPGTVIAGLLTGNIGNVVNVRFENGSVTAPGNVTAVFFVGNGALLENIPHQNIQGTVQTIGIAGNIKGDYANVVNIIATTGNVANVRFSNGNISTSGNIAAGLFVGNGAGLVNLQLSNIRGTIQSIDVSGNVTGSYANVSNVFASKAVVNGNADASYLLGNGYSLQLRGLTLKPIPSVANVEQRLALTGIQEGTYVIERDLDIPYFLVSQPPSQSNNWIEFVSLGAVTSVFDAVGFITAQPGDYSDSLISLSSNIGPAIANVGYVSDALAYLNTFKANVVNGNVSANFFLGNVISTGNMIANLFVGNGADLFELSNDLQGTIQPIGIRGNVIGAYANVANVIATLGNIANVTFRNGNIFTSGNVTAGLFVGNGAGLFDLPGNIQGTIQPLGIRGNVIGAYANVSNIIATAGNVANVRFENGNIFASGNVTAGLFVGNGAGLSIVLGNIQGTIQSLDIRGNVIGAYANVANVIATSGNIGNVRFDGGNIATQGTVSARIFSGNVIGEYANVTNIIATSGNVGNVRFDGGNMLIPGAVSAGIFSGNVIGEYANVANVIAISGNVGGVRFVGGNVTTQGTMSAGIFAGNVIGGYAIVANVIAVAGNIGNVQMDGGFVTAQSFTGNGGLLTDVSPPTFTVVSAVSDLLTSLSSRNRLYTGSFTFVSLPDATTLSVGTSFLIMSGQAFADNTYTRVRNNLGATLYNVCSKGSCQFTLTSNATQAGTWNTVASGEKNAGLMVRGTNGVFRFNQTTSLRYETALHDNLLQYNTGNGTFTAANDGQYLITAAFLLNQPSWGSLYYWYALTSSGLRYTLSTEQTASQYSGYLMTVGSASIYLSAGQSFNLYVTMGPSGSAISVVNDVNYNILTVAKIPI